MQTNFHRILTTGAMALAVTFTAMAEDQSQELGHLAKGNTKFAFDLYGQLQGEKGNLFFSPYSISTALAMTYGGARGETATQMTQALSFPAGSQDDLHRSFAALVGRMEEVQASGKVALNIANSLWPQQDYKFLDKYMNLMKKQYGVSITPVDYKQAAKAARVTINTWVEDKTREKIKDLIAPGSLSTLTRMVLVNAIYFKGDWALQFKEKNTRDAPFWISPDQSVPVAMMHQTDKFKYAENDKLQILELPYVGKDLSMLVLLPRKKGGIRDLEASLSASQLNVWCRLLGKREVQVFLPKFKLSWGTKKLKGPLMALGMKVAFAAGAADFSGMDGHKVPAGSADRLYLGQVLHKAFVEVNEEGTEAAAATAVVIRIVRMPRPPPVFRADHPFLFIIQENKTGSILFMGRLSNPKPIVR